MNKKNAGKSKGITPAARKPLISALEPRVLLDGAALATAAELTTDLDYKQSTDSSSVTDTANHDIAPDLPKAPAPTQIQSAEPALNGGRKEVVFVDSNVTDYQTLINNIGKGVEIELLNGAEDGLSQINTWAQNNQGYDAVYILSHGNSAEINLGTLTLNNDNINAYSSSLAQIGQSLTADGDILVYGCDVTKDASGKTLINSLAQLTQADVAASSDITGNNAQGGNWTLEYTSGQISSSLFSETTFADYNYTLGTSVSLTGSAGWTAIMYGTGRDPQGDSQAGAADTDIIGDATHGSLYTAYSDGGTPDDTSDDYLYFRMRIDNPTSSTNFGGVAIVGMDANGDGRVDLFMSVDGRNNTQAVRLLDPGTGLNNSPNTTTTSALPTGWLANNGVYSFNSGNYSVVAVSELTDPNWSASAMNPTSGSNSDLSGDGKTDVFISWKIPLSDIATVLSKPSTIDRTGTVGPRGTTGIQGFNQNTVVSYVSFTQTQPGPINGDLNGVGASYDKNLSFAQLGAFTAPMTASSPAADGLVVTIIDPIDSNNLLNATEDNSTTVHGSAPADSWLKVVISDGNGGDLTYWTQTDSTGTWSITKDTSALSDGQLTIRADIVAADNSSSVVSGSTGDSTTVTHDTTPPAITANALVTTGKPVISGTSTDVPVGNTVTITIDPNGDGILSDLLTYTTVVTAGGGWSINTATATPASGSMPSSGLTSYAKITASSLDAAGNSGSGTALDKPTINALTTNDTTPTINGTWGGSNSGTDTLTVRVNGVDYTTANGLLITDKSWSLTTPTLAANTYEVTATTSRSGISATDITTNELVVINGASVAIDNLVDNTDKTPVISGTSTEAYVIVTIDPDNNPATNNSVTYTATVTNGHWSIDTGTATPIAGTFPTDGLTSTFDITAKVTDSSGTEVSANRDLTIVAPAISIANITGANTAGGSGLQIDNILNDAEDNSVTITGTADNLNGQTITLTVSDGTTTKTLTALVTSGSWTATFDSSSTQLISALKDGTLTVNAKYNNIVYDTTYIQHDATSPTIKVNSPATLSNQNQIIEGVTDLADGSSVLVTIVTSANQTITQTVTVSGGKWTTSTLSLPSGSTSITVSSTTGTDTAGNAAIGETVTRTVASNNGFKQPDLSINTIATDNIITSPEVGTGSTGLTITGSFNTQQASVKSGTINITITGASLSTGQSTTLSKSYSFSNTTSGTWSVTLTESEVKSFANGSWNVQASLTVSSNTANVYALPVLALANGVGQSIQIDGPIGDGNLSASEDGSVTISGTAINAAGQTISLTVSDGTNTTSAVTTTVAANGTWSVSGLNLSSLNNGTLTATATLGSLQDTQTVLHDKTAPLITITSAPTASDSTPIIAGTSDLPAGSVISVAIDADNNGSTDVTYSATVQADHSWSINTESSSPVSGTFPANGLNPYSKVSTSGTDAAGNNTTLIATTITAISSDSGTNSSDFITNDQTLVFTGKAEPNSSVQISLSGTGVIGTVTTNSSGVWTLDYVGHTLNNGTYTLTAVATKSAGLTATTSQQIEINKQTVAISGISTDSGSSSSDFLTNDAILTYTGTATANSLVTVTLTDENGAVVFLNIVTADNSGNWQLDRTSTPLSNGTYTLTASVTDSSGVSMSETKTVVIDTQAAVSITTNYKSKTTTPTLNGISDLEAGQTLTVTVAVNGAAHTPMSQP